MWLLNGYRITIEKDQSYSWVDFRDIDNVSADCKLKGGGAFLNDKGDTLVIDYRECFNITYKISEYSELKKQLDSIEHWKLTKYYSIIDESGNMKKFNARGEEIIDTLSH